MILLDKPRKRLGLRCLALFTCFIFSFTTLTWADGGASLSLFSSSRLHSPETISRIFIPPELGRITKSYQGTKKELVVYIQDAHLQEDAQRHIAGILQHIRLRYGTKLVGLEGASGELAHHLFSAFPHPQARELIADYFLRKGLIGGPEYLAIARHPELVLYGLEDSQVYEQNRQIFLEALKFKKRDEEGLAGLRKVMGALASHVFSKTLQDLMRQSSEFENNEKTFAAYLLSLAKEAETLNLPQKSSIWNFLEILEAEKHLKWEKIEKEMDLLSSRMRRELSGDPLAVFVQKNADFKSGGISALDYYSYLGKRFSGNRLASEASHLAEYLRYLERYESVGVELMDDIRQLHEQVKMKLLRTREERTLNRFLKILEIEQKIFNFDLTEEDAVYFYKHRSEFKAKFLEKNLRRLLAKYHFDQMPDKNFFSLLDTDLAKVEKFYEIALKRDAILTSRFLIKMKQAHQPVTALVTGGFHTSGIEKFLQKEGYSYVVVTPRLNELMDKSEEQKRYISAMHAKPSYFLQLLEKSYLSQSPLVNDPRFQLQTPRLLPTLELLKAVQISAEKNINFSQMIRKYPSLGFAAEGVILLGLTGIRLGESDPQMVEKVVSKLSPEEKPLGRLLYSWIYDAQNSIARRDQDRSGMFFSRPFGNPSLTLKSRWFPTPKQKIKEFSAFTRSEVRVETKDDYTLEIQWVESQEKSLKQLQLSSFQKGNGKGIRILIPPIDELLPLIPWDRIDEEDKNLFPTVHKNVSFDFIVARRAYMKRFHFPSKGKEFSIYEIFKRAGITPESTSGNPVRSSVRWTEEERNLWEGNGTGKIRVRIYEFFYLYPNGSQFRLDLAVTGFGTGQLKGKLRMYPGFKPSQPKPENWDSKKLESRLEVLKTSLNRLSAFEMSLRQKRLKKMEKFKQEIQRLQQEVTKLQGQIQIEAQALERLKNEFPLIFERKRESKFARIRELAVSFSEKAEALEKAKKEFARQQQLLESRKARIEKLAREYQTLQENQKVPEPVSEKKATEAEIALDTRTDIEIAEEKTAEEEKKVLEEEPGETGPILEELKKNPNAARAFIEKHGVDKVKKMIAGLLGKTEEEVEEQLDVLLQTQEEGTLEEKEAMPVLVKPSPQTKPRIPFLSLIPVISLGFLLFGTPLSSYFFLGAGLLALAGFQAGKIIALFVNEWSHLLAALFLGYFQNVLTLKNWMGNLSLSEWLRGFFSFQHLNPYVEIPGANSWRHAVIRNAGWVGSLGLTAVSLSLIGFYFSYLSSLFFLAAGAGLFAGIFVTFFRALSSDFFVQSPKEGIYCCGNEGGALATKDTSDVEWFNDLIEKMTEVQVIRGEQAAGQVGYMAFGNDNNLTAFRARIVKSKRGKLPKALRKAADRALRWASFFKRLRFPEIIRIHAHTRYGTSSRPAVEETQPVGRDWWAGVWSVVNGKLVFERKKVSVYVSHNGDFDFWEQFNQNIPFQFIRDEWAQKVLGVRNPAVGDTPRVGEMMEVLFTQGMPVASLRYGFQFAVAQSPKDPAPPQAIFQKWAKIFDQAFEQWISERTDKTVTSLSEVSKPQMRQFGEILIRALKKDTFFQEWIPKDKSQRYIQETLKAFFKQDLYNAVRLFRERAKGSFGLVVTSTLEPDKIIIAANAQPMSIGFHPDLNLVVWGSESAALKVPFKARGKEESIPFRYDLNQETGTIAELTVVPKSLPKLKIYSEEKKWELNEEEVVQSGRVIDMRDNPLIEKLPEFDKEDLVGADIREMAHVLDQIRRNWQDSNSFNRQTGEAFLSFLLEKDVQKRIEAKLNRKKLPAAIEKIIREKSVSFTGLHLSGQFSEDSLELEIKKTAVELLKTINLLDQENLNREQEKWAAEEIPDVVITGIEVSQWLGEQFAADLKRLFPALKVESVSSNKILQGLENAYFKNGRRDFTVQENNRTIRINQNTIILTISQSGQTFPTLNAAIVLNRILKGRVFALTGGLDTLMGKAVGQVYAKGAPFSARIFDNLSGLRPAEPSSLASASTHATLTEILLYSGSRMRQLYKKKNPLGMIYEKEDLEQLNRLRDDVLRDSISSITGFSSNAGHDKIQSPVNKELMKLAKRWSQHILEYGIVTAVVALVVSSLVYFGIPFFPGQFAWFPRPSWLASLFTTWDISIPSLVFSILDAGWFIPLGAAYFIVFSYPFTLILRILQRRFPLFQRTGKRTIVLGALPYVHQLLEAYVSKLFSLSYGFATVDVHGANARDHMIARFGHRIVRGLLSLLLKPDGRVESLRGAEGATDMTHSQMEGVENFKVGTEVFTIGRNPRSKASTAGGHLVLPDHRTPVRIPHQVFLAQISRELELSSEQKSKLEKIFLNLAQLYPGVPLRRASEKIGESIGLMDERLLQFEEAFLKFSERQFQLEQFYDSRLDSFEGLVSGYVLFWAIAKKVARFFRWVFLTFDIAASQSRTRVGTTRMPERAPDMTEIIRHFEKDEIQDNAKPVISMEALPFQVVVSPENENEKQSERELKPPVSPVPSKNDRKEEPAQSPQKELADILLTEIAKLYKEQQRPPKNGAQVSPSSKKINQPGRSEVRAAEMGEALRGEKPFKFQNFKLAAFESVQHAKAMEMEEHLHEVLASFGANSDILASLGVKIPAKSSAKGYYFLDFKPDYEMTLIRRLLNRRPENVTIVIFVETAEQHIIEKIFAAETKQNLLILPKTQFEDFIQAKLKELRLESSAVTYLRTLQKAEELKQYEADALLGIMSLAQGGLAGASSVPVAGAHELNLYQVITAAFKAARLVAKSA